MISTLHIIDPQPLVREGFRHLVAKESDLFIKYESGNGEDAIRETLRDSADMFVLEIDLPGRSGIDTLAVLHDIVPKAPILVYTHYPEEHYIVPAMRAGASGLLSKSEPSEVLMVAIRKVLSGEHFLSSVGLNGMTTLAQDPQNAPLHVNLSPREFEILTLHARGFSSREIADILNIAPSTADSYKQRILPKLHLNSTKELAVYAFKNKLLEY